MRTIPESNKLWAIFRLVVEYSVYVDELKGSSEFSGMIHLSAFRCWFRVRVKLSFFLRFSHLSNTFDVPIQVSG